MTPPREVRFDMNADEVELARQLIGDGRTLEAQRLILNAAEREGDARALRRAAAVLQRRSRKPRSFLLGVIVRMLEQQAESIEGGR